MDNLRCFIDLRTGKACSPADVEQYPPLAPSIEVSNNGLDMAIRAASAARFSPLAVPIPIKAEPVCFHYGFHIRKVAVYDSRHSDQVRNALYALTEDIVSDAEGIIKSGILFHHL